MTTTSPATTTPPTTTGSSAAANAAASTAASKISLGNDINTFLNLLTNQLKNQDPLSPLDTNQFTSQLVQFSQVEQAINENDKLSTLIALQSTNEAVGAVPLVGKIVQYSDNQVELLNGQAEFAYNLPNNATNATFTITDAAGNTVATAVAPAADLTAGDHVFNWNGKGNDGSQLPDGVYTFNVSATASDKSAITAAISAFGKVDGIKVDSSGTPSLQIGDLTEAIGKIVNISAGGT